MPRLSVIMIVRNEALCLGDCLHSVASIADEIVIADTGSTDDTRAIAESVGARVFCYPWEEDFAAARNATIAAATGDWLLHMDADEMLDPPSAARLRELVDADGAGADAVELVLANYCDDPRAWRWQPTTPGDPWARGHSGYLPVPLLRLFRRGCGYEYREPVHENITASVHERGGRIASSEIVIHHYGYASQGERGKRKIQQYLEIARRKAASRPEDSKALYDLAEQAVASGYLDEAEQACRRLLAHHPDHMPGATTLANIHLLRGELADARSVLESIFIEEIGPPHVHTALGTIDLYEGDWNSADIRFHAALEADPKQIMARLYLARLLDLRGEQSAACQVLKEAQQVAPGLPETALRLKALAGRERGAQAYKSGRLEEALQCLVEALRADPEDPLLHNNLGVVLHTLGERTMAIESFRRALSLMPCLDRARENLSVLEQEDA